MDNNVIINKTENRDGNIIVYFLVPSLSIDSHLSIDNKVFEDLMYKGGFSQLSLYLVEQLDVGLQALLKGGAK